MQRHKQSFTISFFYAIFFQSLISRLFFLHSRCWWFRCQNSLSKQSYHGEFGVAVVFPLLISLRAFRSLTVVLLSTNLYVFFLVQFHDSLNFFQSRSHADDQPTGCTFIWFCLSLTNTILDIFSWLGYVLTSLHFIVYLFYSFLFNLFAHFKYSTDSTILEDGRSQMM